MLHLNSYNGFDFITCYNRRIDGSPRSNIDRCYVVSVARHYYLPPLNMRTYSKMCFRHVAIPTHDLESSGKIIFPQPPIKTVSACVCPKNTFSVDISTPIDMVNRQKSDVFFPTTNTYSTVMRHNVFFEFYEISMLFLLNLIRIATHPVLVSSTMFLSQLWGAILPPVRIFFLAFITQLSAIYYRIFPTSWAKSFLQSFIITLFVSRHNYTQHNSVQSLNSFRYKAGYASSPYCKYGASATPAPRRTQ